MVCVVKHTGACMVDVCNSQHGEIFREEYVHVAFLEGVSSISDLQ